MRLFVSVDLPPSFTDRVSDLQREFEDVSGLDLVDPAQTHVTLKFLGEVTADRIPALESGLAGALEESGLDPFTVRYAGLGVFPSLEYIRVLWLGVEDGSEALTRLHERIEARTTAMGFDSDSHEFTPHVTLGRMKHAGGKDRVQELVRERTPELGETTVDAISLTESTLTPGGPAYETVASFPLE